MSKASFYKQCRLNRQTPQGVEQKVSWIPDEYAIEGNVIKLRNNEGTWVSGWRVMSTSEPFPAELIEKNSRDYLKQRKASDIVFSKLKEEN